MLNDALIRKSFSLKFLSKSKAVYHEIAVKRGVAIADIVVINNHTHCYEIKSDVDSLSRLPSQVSNFSDVFNKVTLITTVKHVDKAALLIPSWWGLIIAKETVNGEVVFNYQKKSYLNPKDTTSNLLAMLWNDELKNILNVKKISYKKSFNRDELIDVLINNSSSKSIAQIFSTTMTQRINRLDYT